MPWLRWNVKLAPHKALSLHLLVPKAVARLPRRQRSKWKRTLMQLIWTTIYEVG